MKEPVIMRKLACGLLAALSLVAAQAASADESKRIGTVDTTFKLLGRNDRIAVDRYDDPLVDGVSCYVSRAETGGVKGSLGLARDPSRYSIACRATGPVHIHEPLPANQVVFTERASLFFKSVRVTRLYDAEKHVLLYLVWSTETLTPEGSPYNSITAVPLDR
jgi:CreA protein